MNDEEMKNLVKRIAELYELELETAKWLLLKIINTIYGNDMSTDGG